MIARLPASQVGTRRGGSLDWTGGNTGWGSSSFNTTARLTPVTDDSPITASSRYSPRARPSPVCRPGGFRLRRSGPGPRPHIRHVRGLDRRRCPAKWAYDPDQGNAGPWPRGSRAPGWQPARLKSSMTPPSELVAGACVPARPRGPWHPGAGGKDYFSDKPALTTLAQLEQARRPLPVAAASGPSITANGPRRERRVRRPTGSRGGRSPRSVQVIGLARHRADVGSRPPWFSSGSVTAASWDIGSHQAEQFLYYTANVGAEVTSSRVANYAHKEHPGLEDFGDCALLGANGATGYFRVDWFTPDGLFGPGAMGAHVPPGHGGIYRVA